MNAHIGGINSENLRVSFLFHLLLTNGKYIKCISILLGVVSSLPLSISFGVVRNILWLPTLVLRLNIVLLLTLPQNFFSYVGSYKISLSLSPLLLLFVVTIWMPNWSQWHLRQMLSYLTSPPPRQLPTSFCFLLWSAWWHLHQVTLLKSFSWFFFWTQVGVFSSILSCSGAIGVVGDPSALLGPPYHCISYLGNNLCSTTIYITLMYWICCTVCTIGVKSMWVND